MMKNLSTEIAALSCLRASLYIAELIDGVLPDERRRTLAAHVRDCPHCRRMLLAAVALHQAERAVGARVDTDCDGATRLAEAIAYFDGDQLAAMGAMARVELGYPIPGATGSA
jgi:anti-sigma factor RsiW